MPRFIRLRWAAPALLVSAVAAGGWSAGCGSTATNAGACTTEGCECPVEGATAECGTTLGQTADAITCRAGTQTCSGGHWGACSAGSSVSIKSRPKLSAKSTAPTKCTDNPCDPDCQSFDDNPSDIDAGGIAITDGGITLAEGGTGGPGTGPCTNLTCQIDACSGDYTKTQLTGKVYDPAGKNPLYNVLVYIPNSAVSPLTDGVSCAACATGSGSPIVSALTDYTGSFTLKGVPNGANIPLVIQSGKWRRQLTIPTVTKCVTNDTTSMNGADGLKLVRFPKNRSEGDIPRIAFVSGSADPFQCVLSKMGMDVSAASSEVGVPYPGTPTFSSDLQNGDFESASLSTGWATSGTATKTNARFHGASGNSVFLGSTSAYVGTSSVTQTFTAPTSSPSSPTLSFWYSMACSATDSNDYATATLTDVTAGGSTTILSQKANSGTGCTSATNGWTQVAQSLTAGHQYTLKLQHQDNGSGGKSGTYFDDVTVTGSVAGTTLGPRRIHYYQGTNSAGKDLSSALGGPAPTADSLYDTAAHLDQYDAVILSCEGDDYDKGATVNQNLADYVAAGGRMFATHFSYRYLQSAPAASQWPQVVKTWNHTGNPASPMTTVINRSFSKGDNFALWLNYVGASPTVGQLSISEGRHDYDYVDTTRATPWMYDNSSGAAYTSAGGSCYSAADCDSNKCSATPSTTVPNNGGFESGGGSTTGWTTSSGFGSSISMVTGRVGGKAVQLGSTTTATGDSWVSQTFTAPAGTPTLRFWVLNNCHDNISYDWATATLVDNTASSSTTVLPKTCAASSFWTPITVSLTGGHSYTLTLLNHDDYTDGDASASIFDDVEVYATAGTCGAISTCTTDADCPAGTGVACWNGTCVPPHDMEPLMTFNVPVGAAPASQCGRVVYSDFHVSASALSGSGNFPDSCATGDLSSQEKALEFMLFDLTSCLTPDYAPPSTPPFKTTTVSRDYAAVCPTGTKAVWRWFDWKTITPSDTHIVFSAQTGDTVAAMSAMTPVPLADVSGAPITNWTGVDVNDKFTKSMPPVANGSMLRINITLQASTDGKSAPTLVDWRQSYDCKASE